MKPIISLLLALLIVGAPAFAQDGKPSDESVHRLLEVTDVEKLVEGMMGQMDGMMKTIDQKMLQGQPVTPEQQKALEVMRAKVTDLMKKELGWNVLEPMYLKVYQDSFTQAEVDGMLDFYRTPAGQAVIRKLPLVLQNSMTAMQDRMGPLMQKVQQIVKETVDEIKTPHDTAPGNEKTS